MTNIVVVQFNDNVQTSRDKKYNLTCYMSGPGETVVTSSYMDTRTDGSVSALNLLSLYYLLICFIYTSNHLLRYQIFSKWKEFKEIKKTLKNIQGNRLLNN